ncbi:hypothetical protein [Pseudomonas fluorescens]|nr:hypothetical protein [Pseudomonas fluorescens]
MSTDPVIEVVALDMLAYKEDRATVICRPHLVLMLNPICGCVLNKTIEATGSRSDALAGALSSWRLGSGTPKFVIDDGRDFHSTTFVSVTMGAGYKIQYSPLKPNGIVERAVMRLTQRMRHWQVGKEDSTHLTLAEIQRRVEIRVAIHNERIRKIRKVRRAGSVYKVAGTGISLSVRRAYYTVLNTSVECGFDAEQVSFIWQTASYAYSACQLRMMFEEIVGKFHSNAMYHDYSRTDVTHLQSLFKPPIEILEGEGAVAIRTLAYIKDLHDKKPFIWIDDFYWTRSIGSWADLTYVLLEKLVKDGLATDSLRCKLFARDLGL